MFPLHVLAADKPFYEGDCESLVVPTLDGEYGVLAGHCNTICAIVPGELTFRTPDGEALVLVDSALRPEDIDAERQRRKADEAKEALLQRRSIEEHHAAQARLARALARLNVKRKYGQ